MEAKGPLPCAGTLGTTLLVEDMFYNVPQRKKAIKSPSEEFARILDVVGRYAVFSNGTSFSVKRQGEARPDLHTNAGASQLDAIRCASGKVRAMEGCQGGKG